MELGGKNPQIVFPDADLDAALDAAPFGAYFNAGECCNAGSRLLLHASDRRRLSSPRSPSARATVKVGDPLDPETRSRRDHQRRSSRPRSSAMSRRRGRAGARLRARRRTARLERPVHGADGRRRVSTPSMAIAREEVFGPVVVALDLRHRRRKRSRSPIDASYGLSASVWSRDLDTVIGVGRRVRAGTVWVNTFMDGTPELPFGGYQAVGRRPGAWPQRRRGLH